MAKILPPGLNCSYYSVLKLLTGLLNPAFMAWKLMVAAAINNAASPAAPNIHHEMLIR